MEQVKKRLYLVINDFFLNKFAFENKFRKFWSTVGLD